MNYKVLLSTTLAATCLLSQACNADSSNVARESSETTSSSNEPSSPTVQDKYHWNEADETRITLSDGNIQFEGSGATVEGKTLTISQPGTFRVSGSIEDGQIQINTDDKGTVRLILDNVSIHNTDNAAIHVIQATETILISPTGSNNFISDGSKYSKQEDDPNAAIFSSDDLVIYGDGTLSVTGNYNDAITSKDTLLIKNANLIVEAKADDGIRGKDHLKIENSVINVNSVGDGLKSTNDDEGLGFIQIKDSQIDIKANADGIQAKSDIHINGGNSLNIVSGGGHKNTLADDDSAKGLKANGTIDISDSALNIDAADDAIHTAELIHIHSGTFNLVTADDAIHADYDVTIDGGDILVTHSYEAIEGAHIVINDGNINININITSSDDALNGASSEVRNPSIVINGGTIVIDAEGDGVDVNGDLEMNGGTLLVNGPTRRGNGALDYDGDFDMNGGVMIAVGAGGMPSTIGRDSKQNGGLIGLTELMPAGSLIHFQDDEGKALFTFKSKKVWQAAAFSLPQLSINSSWNVYTGGRHSGSQESGLYSEGEYSPGNLYGPYVQSETVTQIGEVRRRGHHKGDRGRGRPPEHGDGPMGRGRPPKDGDGPMPPRPPEHE